MLADWAQNLLLSIDRTISSKQLLAFLTCAV